MYYCRRQQAHQPGFSLVEILVAMAIGMVTMLVILQVLSTAEAHRRSVSSGSDAGTSGAIALQGIQRDLLNSGYGLLLDTVNLFTACGGPGGVVSGYNSTRSTAAFTIQANQFLPVAIYTPGNNPAGLAAADANTDIIQVIYGGSNFSVGRGIQVTDDAVAGRLNTVVASGFVTSGLTVATGGAAESPHLALILQGTNCALTQLTTIASVSQINRATSVWNEAGNFNRGLNLAVGNPGTLYSLGPPERFVIRAYAVRGGRLTACSPIYQDCALADEWVSVGDGVVSLRAQFGVDTDNNDVVDTWTAAAPANWEDAKVVRVALVSRGQDRQRDPIANSDCTPSWAGNDNDSLVASLGCPAGAPPAAQIVLNSADTPDSGNWDRYRHRVFQTTVPVRNMFWSNN